METKNDFIQKELQKFNLPDAVIAKLKDDYLPLKVSGVDDIDNYIACKEAHSIVRKVRTAIEKRRVALKTDSIDFGRRVETEAKRLTKEVGEVEAHLLAQRKVVEDEKERIKNAAIEAARLEEERIEKEKRDEEDRLRKEEEARLEAIRKEQDETARKQKEAQEMIDAEKKKIEDEKQKIADEKRREEEEKTRQEELEKAKKESAEKARKDAEEKAEREKKEEAERIERERIAEENRKIEEQKEKERQEALRPDADKLKGLSIDISGFIYPDVSSVEAQDVIKDVKQKMLRISNEILNVKL